MRSSSRGRYNDGYERQDRRRSHSNRGGGYARTPMSDSMEGRFNDRQAKDSKYGRGGFMRDSYRKY